jgi:hypothetical protein
MMIMEKSIGSGLDCCQGLAHNHHDDFGEVVTRGRWDGQ